MQVAFNSSMPRSGSELLQGILSQHPDVTASATSPLLEYVAAAHTASKTAEEAKAQIDPEPHIHAFVRGAITGYAESQLEGEATLYIDKSRGWLNYSPLVEKALGEKPKILCCVRDIADVVASMEGLHRRNAPVGLGDPFENVGVVDRVNNWMSKAPIGIAARRIINALDCKYGFHGIRYEDLCESPGEVMKGVLDYLGLRPFSFDFRKIRKSMPENELAFNVGPGLHKVDPVLKKSETKAEEILGEKVAKEVRETNSVYQRAFGYA